MNRMQDLLQKKHMMIEGALPRKGFIDPYIHHMNIGGGYAGGNAMAGDASAGYNALLGILGNLLTGAGGRRGVKGRAMHIRHPARMARAGAAHKKNHYHEWMSKHVGKHKKYKTIAQGAHAYRLLHKKKGVKARKVHRRKRRGAGYSTEEDDIMTRIGGDDDGGDYDGGDDDGGYLYGGRKKKYAGYTDEAGDALAGYLYGGRRRRRGGRADDEAGDAMAGYRRKKRVVRRKRRGGSVGDLLDIVASGGARRRLKPKKHLSAYQKFLKKHVGRNKEYKSVQAAAKAWSAHCK